MSQLYILYETATGYAIFCKKDFDSVAMASMDGQVLSQIADGDSFVNMVKLVGLMPFSTSDEALAEIQAVISGECSPLLQEFLTTVFSSKKVKKALADGGSYNLGVAEQKLAEAVKLAGYPVVSNNVVKEITRGIRQHFSRFVDTVSESEVDTARCGLGHSYSRTAMKFDVNRQDKPVVNTICLLDLFDKDLNTFTMRMKEWYGWHFPELGKIVTDNLMYAKCVGLIGDREKFDFADEANLRALSEILSSEDTAAEIAKASAHSMGQEVTEFDMLNMVNFAKQVERLTGTKTHMSDYLTEKMEAVAPNLSHLMGPVVGARLLSQSGSLTNLAKCPASTIQILGAEKALFRALKNKGNTPKYGLIYHSTYIGKAAGPNKGRISRYVANKCAIAARMDCFSDVSANGVVGDALKQQVAERLEYLDSGKKPQRSSEIMHSALKAVRSAQKRASSGVPKVSSDTPKANGHSEEHGVDAAPAKKKKKTVA